MFFTTLERMGFGPSFIRWVLPLYSKATCSIFDNGYSLPVFYPTCGVRQGCPLLCLFLSSPWRFELVILEYILLFLISRSQIVRYRCLVSRDPFMRMTPTIVPSDPDIKAVLDTYDRFERASGSKLNLGKCKGLWLGSF